MQMGAAKVEEDERACIVCMILLHRIVGYVDLVFLDAITVFAARYFVSNA